MHFSSSFRINFRFSFWLLWDDIIIVIIDSCGIHLPWSVIRNRIELKRVKRRKRITKTRKKVVNKNQISLWIRACMSVSVCCVCVHASKTWSKLEIDLYLLLLVDKNITVCQRFGFYSSRLLSYAMHINTDSSTTIWLTH